MALEQLQLDPGGVELIPGQAVPRRNRVRVVVVVPAFAECQQRHPPRVLRVVLGGEAAVSPHVGGRVDEPRGVQADDHAQEDRPVDHRPAADGEQDQSHGGQRNPVIRGQPLVEGVAAEVRRVARHDGRVVVLRVAEHHPAQVRPEAAHAGRVRVERLVGMLVMLPVDGHPEHRAALERQRAADGQEIFEQLRCLEPAVRVQPVIAHADAETDGHPVKGRGDHQVGPAELEQGDDGQHVEDHEHDQGQPVDLRIPGYPRLRGEAAQWTLRWSQRWTRLP